MIGQNGFVTASLFIAGACLVARRPWIGGGLLGLLVIKPQLAILVPLALAAGRHWRAFAAAAISSLGALVLAGLIFGFGRYQEFLNILPVYTRAMADNLWPWQELASPFAVLRSLGIVPPVAIIIHAVIALWAALMTARAWRRGAAGKEATLAAAAMLIPPYIFTYDSLLLALPLAWFARDGSRPYAAAAIWIFSFLPVVRFFGWYDGPNTIALASIIALVTINSRARADVSPPMETATAPATGR
jgi:hypothetical protein